MKNIYGLEYHRTLQSACKVGTLWQCKREFIWRDWNINSKRYRFGYTFTPNDIVMVTELSHTPSSIHSEPRVNSIPDIPTARFNITLLGKQKVCYLTNFDLSLLTEYFRLIS